MRSKCVEWMGAKNAAGYGITPRRIGSTRLAHRFAFLKAFGYLPPVVRHDCDNPSCVNPKHLSGGTHRDNVRDCIKRGRNSKPPGCDLRGEKHPLHKLSWDEVRLIRALLKRQESVKRELARLSQHTLAMRFKVTQSVISSIKRNESWVIQ